MQATSVSHQVNESSSRHDAELLNAKNATCEWGSATVSCSTSYNKHNSSISLQQSTTNAVVLWILTAFITAAMDAFCSTTVPVGMQLHWSTGSRPLWVGMQGWLTLGTGSTVWQANWKKLDKDYSLHTSALHWSCTHFCITLEKCWHCLCKMLPSSAFFGGKWFAMPSMMRF